MIIPDKYEIEQFKAFIVETKEYQHTFIKIVDDKYVYMAVRKEDKEIEAQSTVFLGDIKQNLKSFPDSHLITIAY